MYLAPVETPASNVPIPAASSASRGHSPQPQAVTPTSAANVEPVAGAVGGHPATGSATHDDAVLRERLKHMGKSKHCIFSAYVCFGFALLCSVIGLKKLVLLCDPIKRKVKRNLLLLAPIHFPTLCAS